MIDELLKGIRTRENFSRAIITSVVLEKDRNLVTVCLVTDKAYTEDDRTFAVTRIKSYVPDYFDFELKISKLSPDCGMVKSKIYEGLCENFKYMSAMVSEDDISVKKTENGFEYEIKLISSLPQNGITDEINLYLKRHFCGEFFGVCVKSDKDISDLQVEEEHENIEFELPIRYFDIADFSCLEGSEKHKKAVYMSDINFESDNVVVCGQIDDIRERTYTNKKNIEKTMYSFYLSDTTATMRATYFPRMKSIDKIKKLKVGDSIVCTGKTELYNGIIRYTANTIDFGKVPKNFVPEKRPSKPVNEYYSKVTPTPFSDFSQTDMFSDTSVPKCLLGKSFVVFDLETTGLNSSPSSGNMDRIIEIAAYKIVDGCITEQFSTFLNPERKLSDEIVHLTGITEDMLKSAPTYEEALPDFYKFCYGSILVGHNVAGFDFKFVEYYCAKLGYILERKIMDTLPLSQELLFLSNYKLNTVADKFGIEFNHHRATDDAYVTAKIFLELIKIKKSLPKLQ